jgi:hypothetical protein
MIAPSPLAAVGTAVLRPRGDWMDSDPTAPHIVTRCESMCRCPAQNAAPGGRQSSDPEASRDAARRGSPRERLIGQRTGPWSTSFMR